MSGRVHSKAVGMWLEDLPRSGQPSTSSTEVNIAKAKEMVTENRHLRVLLLSKLKKKTIFKYLKKNYFIYNYNFFHTLLTIF